MRRQGYLMIMASLVVVLTGCATSQEWTTWKEHPAHFSSSDHLFFSVRNREGRDRPAVTRRDVATAREQGWWGQPVTVGQEQVIER